MSTHPATSSPGPNRSLRLQCGCTLLVAVGAAYVSYRHGREFALRFGADETTATLWPLIVDGLLTMATIELWQAGHRHRHRHRASGQWKAWGSFTLGIGLSLCANISSAPELNTFAIAVAACPPLALLLSVELLNQALKRHRAEATTGGDHKSEDVATSVAHTADSGEPKPLPKSVPDAENAPALRTVAKTMPGHRINATTETLSSQDGDPLRAQAYQLDAEHWNLHQRPISADTLRRQLGIGSRRARALTRHIRQHQSPAALAAVD
ncbi:DUF2637 domain-containing protein [Prauserella oleivorans]|uniref:DUF2637 domain-containing protein n=1 Tax=Prauserella oleivorans TaxID=1478153 RepID=A0ABW5W305_9PSEU|nr:DUF2637 domain-containing protein [Prauserella flavalba]